MNLKTIHSLKTRRARLSFVKGFGRRLKELVSKKTKTA